MAQSLASNAGFVQNIIVSLAASFEVEVEEVSATIEVARRLQSSPEIRRKLNEASLQVDYTIETKDIQWLHETQEVMKDSSSRSEFVNSFRTELQDREASSGRSIGNIEDIIAEEVKVTATEKEIVEPEYTATADSAGPVNSTKVPIPKPAGPDDDSADGTYGAAAPPSTSPLPNNEAEASTSLEATSKSYVLNVTELEDELKDDFAKWDDTSGAVGCAVELLTALVVIQTYAI
eukprot:gnl/MRDRNA2_/MRDRNA2_34300_c1_seq1.p1 gnl/MRDRNA2_/MRDRNA2_34300_c1~~gnl/MRDRNA2_/MRDRNA2_34300_c1_seq1.p1  ORF type:complete len:234 (-),score=46.16 gnl/MRDRNA2_/MRDRNA2_34300_c1_seq1:213-914(-)